ncbi:hypothetical protein [Polyangium fumosum]|uniref:ParB/Sulfiredoxin domain-containing protein n=1 Tax=Polyangium fumosum TaxID=889272 RepID=A0A4U1IIZ3_9BACT|nr:hypothetical protein [Polyangium fumosum]TKC93697.1 hypothetical protein E8A74_48975 [Polyangium fumosum]
MVDYKEWKEKSVAVGSLYLDPKNPRLPSANATLEQREIIAELVKNDDVYTLAKDIAENGYIPIESLVGLEENGRTFILEGNRRLAALKLLVNPEGAPVSELKRFRKLSSKADLDNIGKVRVIFAASREAAAPLIMRKHTRQQVARWSPLMQARYYRTMAGSGVNLEELARQYGTTPSEIATFLRTDVMYDIACGMDLPSDVAEVVRDPRQFSSSTLKRLLDYGKAQEFLGIQFDEHGNLHGKVDAQEFKRGFVRILTDIARNVIDTRTLNKTDDIEKYLSGLQSDTPNKEKGGSFTAIDLAKTKDSPKQARDVPASGPAAVPTPTRPKPPPKPSVTLIPARARCYVENSRVEEVFNELRRLRVDNFPRASTMLLRILLELSLRHFLEQAGKMKALVSEAKKLKLPDGQPTLRQMLTAVLSDDAIPLTGAHRKKLNQILAQADSNLLLDNMAVCVRENFAFPTAKELHGYWDHFDALLQLMFTEADSQDSESES